MDAAKVVSGLGGRENIMSLSSCITRLRVNVAEPNSVSEDELRNAGAYGVMVHGHSVQIVVGPAADSIVDDINELSSRS